MRGKGSLLLIKSVLKRPKPEFGCSFMTNFIQQQTQRCPQTWQALLGPGRGEAFLASRSKMERTVRYTALQRSPRPSPDRYLLAHKTEGLDQACIPGRIPSRLCCCWLRGLLGWDVGTCPASAGEDLIGRKCPPRTAWGQRKTTHVCRYGSGRRDLNEILDPESLRKSQTLNARMRYHYLKSF